MSKNASDEPQPNKKLALIFTGVAVVCVIIGVLLMMYLPVPNTSVPEASRLLQSQDAQKVTVVNQAGESYTFNVEIADDDASRIKGLSQRDSLPLENGMLFDFGATVKLVFFWMKATYFPLDMIFIDENGIITRIFENQQPLTGHLRTDEKPVLAVLEINGGLSSKYGFKPGDKVSHPMFERHRQERQKLNVDPLGQPLE